MYDIDDATAERLIRIVIRRRVRRRLLATALGLLAFAASTLAATL